MSKLQEVAKVESSKKFTENGAMAYDSVGDPCLDLFGTIGALRNRPENEIIEKFKRSFLNKTLLTTKMMFYAGDIRNGGLGERRTFRICLKWMAENYPQIVEKNIALIPHFNRWDSIYELFGTPCEKAAIELIGAQLISDLENMRESKPISLLAKWLKSENTSSKKSKELAKATRKGLGFSARNYRKMLSEMRAYIDVVETYMSQNRWGEIEYEHVPSYAMKNYRLAFQKQDFDRFKQYLDSLKKGETKINASTLYPYDLTSQYIAYNIWSEYKEDEVVEQQWKALPNYVENESNILVMCDVSGSMAGRPIETSIGLGIYFAERNRGPLHNVYMTFTDEPHFQYINEEDSLFRKVEKVRDTDIGYNTDLEAAFYYLLEQALVNNFTQEDMPSAICVISDMEIDPYTNPDNYRRSWQANLYSLDFFETMKQKYEEVGYQMPKLILWNVEARQDTFIARNEDIVCVSGQSASTFKHLAGVLDGRTGYDFMLEVLNSDAYKDVRI